jgi:hypothetical protein
MMFFVREENGQWIVFNEREEFGRFGELERAYALADSLDAADKEIQSLKAARRRALDELAAEAQPLGLYEDNAVTTK